MSAPAEAELVELPHKFRDLKTLARRINDRQEEIDAVKQQYQDLAGTLTRNVRLQGMDLKIARESVTTALWPDWLATHCPRTSPRQAAVCIALTHHQSELAFGAWDMVKETAQIFQADVPERKPEPRPWPAAPNLRNLGLCEKWLGALVQSPLWDCSEAVRERYREQLWPVAKSLWPEKFA